MSELLRSDATGVVDTIDFEQLRFDEQMQMPLFTQDQAQSRQLLINIRLEPGKGGGTGIAIGMFDEDR